MKLPLDCDVEFHEEFLSPAESAGVFDWIIANCPELKGGAIKMADGTLHEINSLPLLFVDRELTDFSVFAEYHGRRVEWPEVVKPVRDRVEALTGVEFPVCLCVYYPDGEASMAFHSDLATSYGPVNLIPAVSLGEQRAYLFRKMNDHSEVFRRELPNGSLLIMGEGCQEIYQHCVPADSSRPNPRISLTFRLFTWPEGHERATRGRLPGG